MNEDLYFESLTNPLCIIIDYQTNAGVSKLSSISSLNKKEIFIVSSCILCTVKNGNYFEA